MIFPTMPDRAMMASAMDPLRLAVEPVTARFGSSIPGAMEGDASEPALAARSAFAADPAGDAGRSAAS
jgi:hypothetical protein